MKTTKNASLCTSPYKTVVFWPKIAVWYHSNNELGAGAIWKSNYFRKKPKVKSAHFGYISIQKRVSFDHSSEWKIYSSIMNSAFFQQNGDR